MTTVITFLFAGSLSLLFADYGQDKYYVWRIITFLQILINYLYVISIIRYSNISYSAGELCYNKFFMQKKILFSDIKQIDLYTWMSPAGTKGIYYVIDKQQRTVCSISPVFFIEDNKFINLFNVLKQKNIRIKKYDSRLSPGDIFLLKSFLLNALFIAIFPEFYYFIIEKLI